jgi:hypothetical protein
MSGKALAAGVIGALLNLWDRWPSPFRLGTMCRSARDRKSGFLEKPGFIDRRGS